ncbi:MAG TPA: hypothetical protein VK903_13815, partial [Propionicimonas sp.]|nr:hypothetical protein [Propionicimonas sp.]
HRVASLDLPCHGEFADAFGEGLAGMAAAVATGVDVFAQFDAMAQAALTACETRGLLSPGALLVAGTSLAVMSGLRFVRHAARANKPIVIVNRGLTRGDELASVRLNAGTSEALSALAERLTP